MQQKFLSHTLGMITILTLATGCTDLNAASLLRYLFGTKPVSSEIQVIADKADDLTNFKTPVLQMNWLAKKIGYSTFNWFNTTWVDEEAIKNNPEFATLWQLVHEKWHTIWGHDVRRIVGVGALFSYIARDIYFLHDAGKVLGTKYYLSALPWELLSLLLVLWHEEYCESQADSYADRVLDHTTESPVDAA